MVSYRRRLPHRRYRKFSVERIKWVICLAVLFTIGILYYCWKRLRASQNADFSLLRFPLQEQPPSPSHSLSHASDQMFESQPIELNAVLKFDSETYRPARFLMGIFTIVEERTQRNLVRRALALYNDSRVCSFGSTNGQMPPRPPDHCQLIYTFVIGANPQGAKQIVKSVTTTTTKNSPQFPWFLLTAPSGLDMTREPNNDLTFLNIQEHEHQGKTPTWFYYASLVMSQYPMDYVIKSKVDTFLYVDQLLNQVAPRHFPAGAASSSSSSLVYAGSADWSYPRRHIYMTGAWYLLSRDLAELLATKQLDKVRGVRWMEDADAGFCLLVRHQMVHLIAFGDDENDRKPWKHPLESISHNNTTSQTKDQPSSETLYRQWIEQESQRLLQEATK